MLIQHIPNHLRYFLSYNFNFVISRLSFNAPLLCFWNRWMRNWNGIRITFAIGNVECVDSKVQRRKNDETRQEFWQWLKMVETNGLCNCEPKRITLHVSDNVWYLADSIVRQPNASRNKVSESAFESLTHLQLIPSQKWFRFDRNADIVQTDWMTNAMCLHLSFPHFEML